MAKETVKTEKPKKKSDKPNWFIRAGRKIKEVFSELKKVNWPTFGKIIKTTSVVLLMVLIFITIYTAINWGLSMLLELLTTIGV